MRGAQPYQRLNRGKRGSVAAVLPQKENDNPGIMGSLLSMCEDPLLPLPEEMPGNVTEFEGLEKDDIDELPALPP